MRSANTGIARSGTPPAAQLGELYVDSSEIVLQPKLDNPRAAARSGVVPACPGNLPKRAAEPVELGTQEPSVIPAVKELGPKLDQLTLGDLGPLH